MAMNMTLENTLKMSGVQSILTTLIEKAAPDLSKQANDIYNTIVAFKNQLDRIERQNALIIKHMGIMEAENGPGSSSSEAERAA